MTFQHIAVHVENGVFHLRLNRPEARNAIHAGLIAECMRAVESCEETCKVLVIEGSPEYFCFGADFHALRDVVASGSPPASDSEALYALWERIAWGSFTSVAHVVGQANAGGVGFVAACDLVIASQTARFSLSEMLFGIYPACVTPFLVRRIGTAKAQQLTLSTQPIGVEQATAWGLVDAYGPDSERVLARYLPRLRRLAKPAIIEYKKYMRALGDPIAEARALALLHNHDMHRREGVMEGIVRYVETSLFPWE